jgi:glycosyltransferase involved in cell wall biosynthesis
MTRIALIAGSYLPERCSVADYTAHLCAALREDCESVVLTTYYAAEAAYDPNAIGVVHGWRLADLPALVRAVHNSKADILHIQHTPGIYGFERAILLLPLLLKASGWRSPIVTTVHEYGWWGQQRHWWDRKGGFLLTLSDAVIVTNVNDETIIHNRLPKLKNPVFHIPIAANVEVEQTDGRVFGQNFSWQSIARAHLEVYSNLVGSLSMSGSL